jgi:SPP1 gp7 family putative phage head morphogenesis protein
MPLIIQKKAVPRRRKPEYQDTRPPDAELRDAYAIAANNELQFARAFMRFTRDLMTPSAMAAIGRAVRADSAAAAVRALPVLEAADDMRDRFERAYGTIIQEAGQAEANRHKWKFKFEIAKRLEGLFGGRVPPNPHSLKWIRERAGAAIADTTKKQQANVRKIVERSFEQGLRGPEVVQQIEAEVGLLAREQDAVERRFQSNLNQGVSPSAAKRDRDRYAASLRTKRAERISRTETIEAQSQGRRDSWKLADEEGLIPPGTEREWAAATESDRTCEICLDLDGQKVALNESYDSAVLGEKVDRPPAHPNCRCTEILDFSKAG